MATDDLTSPGDSVPALRRAVRILDHVGSANAPLTAAEITRALALPKSSAHGLISALLDLGLLDRASEGTYRLGPHIMRWASGFLGQSDLVGEFRRVFADVPALENYTITLTRLEGPDVVYLACRNSAAPLGFTFRIGMRLPAPFTATGKAMLSTFSPEKVRALLAGPWPERLTSNSTPSLPALLEEMEATRARGYSIDDGQIREGMVCIGIPVRDYTGGTVAGIAISLLEAEASRERMDELGAGLQRIASALSTRLGADRGA